MGERQWSPEQMEAARAYWRRREEQARLAREALRQQRRRAVREAVQRLAPAFPAVRAVFLYGSLARPEAFRPESDVDLAVLCDDLETEGRFWRALERALRLNVDLRPCTGAVAEAVEAYGECLYERKDDPSEAKHREGPGSP